MTLKRVFLSLTIPTFFAIISCGQANIAIPKEFVETNPPKVWSDEWYQLNNPKNEFGVSITNGKLDIKKVREEDKCELKITGGTLIGINRDEWGGQLIFKQEDTTQKAVDIKRGNIKFIFNFNGKVYLGVRQISNLSSFYQFPDFTCPHGFCKGS